MYGNCRKFSLNKIYQKNDSKGGSAPVEECKKDQDHFPEPNRIDSKLKQPKVVIIGAGMAGLSAAHRLIKCGISNVVVLEALPRCDQISFKKKIYY